jgi:hypothetical protein
MAPALLPFSKNKRETTFEEIADFLHTSGKLLEIVEE